MTADPLATIAPDELEQLGALAEHAASRAHAAHLRRLGSPAHAYACPRCGSWHVGHPNRRTRQSLRAQRQNRAKDEA